MPDLLVHFTSEKSRLEVYCKKLKYYEGLILLIRTGTIILKIGLYLFLKSGHEICKSTSRKKAIFREVDCRFHPDFKKATYRP